MDRVARPIGHQVTAAAGALVFLTVIVAAQAGAVALFMAGTEGWREPGLFLSLASNINWLQAFALFGILAILFTRLQKHLRAIALTFLLTGFAFGLKAYQCWGVGA